MSFCPKVILKASWSKCVVITISCRQLGQPYVTWKSRQLISFPGPDPELAILWLIPVFSHEEINKSLVRSGIPNTMACIGAHFKSIKDSWEAAIHFKNSVSGVRLPLMGVWLLLWNKVTMQDRNLPLPRKPSLAVELWEHTASILLEDSYLSRGDKTYSR